MGQIRSRIEAGAWQEGDQLPTVRELAEDLQVNFNTVARAYRILDEDGWISTQHGRGSFVLGSAEQPAAGSNLLRQLARQFAGRAERLGFSPEEAAREVGYVLEEWVQRSSE